MLDWFVDDPREKLSVPYPGPYVVYERTLIPARRRVVLVVGGKYRSICAPGWLVREVLVLKLRDDALRKGKLRLARKAGHSAVSEVAALRVRRINDAIVESVVAHIGFCGIDAAVAELHETAQRMCDRLNRGERCPYPIILRKEQS